MEKIIKTDEEFPIVIAIERAKGRHVHISTALRWATRGIRGVKLQSRVLGGRRYTTVANVLAFEEECTRAAERNATNAQATPTQSNAAAKKAQQDLEKRIARKSQFARSCRA